MATQPPIKIVKIPTVENYEFNKSINTMSFNINGGNGFVDGTQSHAQLTILPTVLDSNSTNMILPVSIGVPRTAGDREVFAPSSAVALIRGSKSISKNGFYSSKRYNNIVYENVDWYTSSSELKTAEALYRGGPSSLNYGGYRVRNGILPNTPFITYSRPSALSTAYTTELSKVHQGDVYIPWEYICLSGQSNQFPYVFVGDTLVKVELENVLDVMGVVPVQENYLPQNVECDDNAAADYGSATNPILETAEYENDLICQECPFYVGAPVRLEYNDGATTQNVYTTITQLKIDSATNKLNIVVADPVAAAGGRTDVTLSYRVRAAGGVAPQFTVSWSVIEANALLHKLLLPPSQLEKAMKNMRDLELTFTDYDLLERTLGAGREVSDSITLPPRCMGMAVITPQVGTIISGLDEVSKYRFAIDGKAQYNRDVTVGRADIIARSLYNFELKRFFANMGKRLVKYDAEAVNYVAPNNTDTHAFFPITTPVVNIQQTVNMRLNAEGVTDIAAKNYYYCRMVIRSMMVKDGRIIMA